MKKYLSPHPALALSLLFLFLASGLWAQASLKQIEQDVRGDLEVTWNSLQQASFIRGEIPVNVLGQERIQRDFTHRAASEALLDRYAELFGIRQASSELIEKELMVDRLGMRHLRLQQVYEGYPVYGGTINVHFNSPGDAVVAIHSGFINGLDIQHLRVELDGKEAVQAALDALPNADIGEQQPALRIYPERRSGKKMQARLVWMVELRDASLPARNFYAIDSATGEIVSVIEALTDSRNRQTHDAQQGTNLPGQLTRTEFSAKSGDQDIDDAHDFAGDTYDYFWLTHGRDSYDDHGATLNSTANYGSGYQNAFWNGSQMVYGDGFATNDVAAHELAHAVTEYTANLKYEWQSGALNESFSDIFGAMVDRDDWLLGEDLPIGAIRSLSDPNAYGDPDHVDDWVSTCSDHQGVHTNSGIHNKAFYNVAVSLGKNKAELIFYRGLVTYLSVNSSMQDARAAALQAAADLYGSSSLEYMMTQQGFDLVGLDGVWQPSSNSCGCSFNAVRSDPNSFKDRASMINLAATLYRLRDHFLSEDGPARHYRRLFNKNTGRIASLLMRNAGLRAEAARLLTLAEPGLQEMLDGRRLESPQRIRRSFVRQVQGFLQRLQEADRKAGGGDLARVIESERERIQWDRLNGASWLDAWNDVVSVLPKGE